MTVRMIQRGDRVFLPPYEDVVIQPGDILIVAATRKALTETFTKRPHELLSDSAENKPSEGEGPEAARTGSEQVLAEVVIAPASRMIGYNLQQIGFSRLYNVRVLGIQRRSRMIRAQMTEIRLEAGDVLLVQGPRRDVRALRANRDVLLLEWSEAELPAFHHARRAFVIFLATVGLAALGIAPIAITAVAGAAAMIGFGCLNVRQAGRAG